MVKFFRLEAVVVVIFKTAVQARWTCHLWMGLVQTFVNWQTRTDCVFRRRGLKRRAKRERFKQGLNLGAAVSMRNKMILKLSLNSTSSTKYKYHELTAAPMAGDVAVEHTIGPVLLDIRRTKSATEHSHDSALLHHPQVCQQGQFQASGHRETADCCYQRFGHLQTGGTLEGITR